MKGMLKLFASDLQRMTKNAMVVIVVVGLVAIPSLFTWFNVIASWDPFSNTKNLKVAVANTDEGYKSDLVPIKVNIGEQVLAALRENDDLDWVVTSEDDAISGTETGDYYAAIVLPPDFSADMMTFYANDATPTDIVYYTNEKKNALAPKITGQGADQVSERINNMFTETLSDVALNIVSTVADSLQDGDAQAVLKRLETGAGAAADQLRMAAQTSHLMGTLLDSTSGIVTSSHDLITAAGGTFDAASGAIGQGSAAADDIASTLDSASQALSDAIGQTASGYDAMRSVVDQALTAGAAAASEQAESVDVLIPKEQAKLKKTTDQREALQEKLDASTDEAEKAALQEQIDALDKLITVQQALVDQLTQLRDDLRGGADDVTGRVQQIDAFIDTAKQRISDVQTSFDTNLKPRLDQLGDTISQATASLQAAGQDLRSAAADVAGSDSSLITRLAQAKQTTDQVTASLETAAERFDAVASALGSVGDDGDLEAIRQAIGGNADLIAAALGSPVGLERNAVYPVVSFGAAMAPLYTVLALWVGALLMSVSIRVEVPADAFDGAESLQLHQQYLGRFGVFAFIGLLQSTLLCLGLIFFVQVEAAHPMLLMLAGWVTSLVFTLIVYTAVVAFGNAGKALSVLLLVIQISGSGGAYPLQMLPQWFQNISPFLPATHAVDALRAAIAGTYGADYWIDLGLLSLFSLAALLLGLVLRKPLIKGNRKLIAAIESTKLM